MHSSWSARLLFAACALSMVVFCLPLSTHAGRDEYAALALDMLPVGKRSCEGMLVRPHAVHVIDCSPGRRVGMVYLNRESVLRDLAARGESISRKVIVLP